MCICVRARLPAFTLRSC